MRVIFLRYISRNLPVIPNIVENGSLLLSISHFIYILSLNFAYFLTERTHI